jgi:hypothetical protein
LSAEILYHARDFNAYLASANAWNENIVKISNHPILFSTKNQPINNGKQ